MTPALYLLPYVLAGQLEETSPELRRRSQTYGAWSFFFSEWFDMGLQFGERPKGVLEEIPLDRELGPRRLVSNATGLRQIVEAGYAYDEELSFNVGLTFSTDIAEILVGLAGGVQVGSLVLQTEVSRLGGDLYPQRGVLFEPGAREFSGRLITVRAGYDVTAGHAHEHSAPFSMGALFLMLQQPIVLSLDTNRVFDNTPERAVDGGFNSIGLGFAIDFDNLRGVVRKDARTASWLFIDGDFRLGVGFDIAAAIGGVVEWIGSDVQTLVSRQTGYTFVADASPRFGPLLSFDARAALVGAIDLYGFVIGFQAGYQGGLLALYGLAGGNADGSGAADDEIVGVPLSLHGWVVYGPIVRLAILM